MGSQTIIISSLRAPSLGGRGGEQVFAYIGRLIVFEKSGKIGFGLGPRKS